MPQGQFTRGDRQHFVAFNDAYITRPLACPRFEMAILTDYFQGTNECMPRCKAA